MSSPRRDPLGPYTSPEELARGKRRAVVHLLVAVVALSLAVVASRAVADERLTQTYLLAGGLYLLAGLGPVIRISRTPEFERAD
jgi:hypothetical protein